VLPSYLSLSAATGCLGAVRPLVALLMSSLVLDELAGERSAARIALFAASAVAAAFLMSAAEALLQKRLNLIGEFRYDNLEFLYAKRYMRFDYAHVEDSRVNQMLADIRANGSGGGFGLINLMLDFPKLISFLATLVLSFILLAGMFTANNDAYTRNWITSPYASWLLAALAAVGFIAPTFVRKLKKAATDYAARINPKSNTLFGYYIEYKSVAKAAKDIRLYAQAPALMDILDRRLGTNIWFWFFSRLGLGDGINGAVNGLIGAAVYVLSGCARCTACTQ
jgi:ATP-binding cassette subfamily B protein